MSECIESGIVSADFNQNPFNGNKQLVCLLQQSLPMPVIGEAKFLFTIILAVLHRWLSSRRKRDGIFNRDNLLPKATKYLHPNILRGTILNMEDAVLHYWDMLLYDNFAMGISPSHKRIMLRETLLWDQNQSQKMRDICYALEHPASVLCNHATIELTSTLIM